MIVKYHLHTFITTLKTHLQFKGKIDSLNHRSNKLQKMVQSWKSIATDSLSNNLAAKHYKGKKPQTLQTNKSQTQKL